jgi:protein-disulfide isomerase
MSTKKRRKSTPQKPPKFWERPEVQRLAGFGAFIVTFFVLGVLAFSQNTFNPAAIPTISSSPMSRTTALVFPDSPTLGPADAKVTLVEFLDPECESCRAMFPIVKRVLSEYEGRIRLVVRYFPLHSNSILAAKVTEAAGEQGKYWEMQELLFNRQSEWGEQRTSQIDKFNAYAKELGLDMAKFSAALDNPVYQTKIERDAADAATLNLRGTPSFFVNGQPVLELGYEPLKALVEAELSKG